MLFSFLVLLDLFPSIPYLSGLYLRQCPTVTDEVMASIANSCPLLTELDIGGCSAVTDTSLKLLKKLQYLTSLNISHSQVNILMKSEICFRIINLVKLICFIIH